MLYKKYLLNLNMKETEIDEMVETVKRQTTLNDEEIKSQLKENNYDYIKVIKNHFKINEKKEEKVVTINQEIYKQIRYKMDNIMKEYRNKN